jgi:cytochrome bd ubiquinol oxidase subunit I
MKKIIAIIAALTVFLVLLTFVIIPQQQGNISSTSLEAGALSNANVTYEETLPIQETGLGNSGRSILIAVVMLSHVLFANLHLGGAWIAAGTESVFLKNRKERFKRLARSLTLFNVILFSVGATLAVSGILFFIALYPRFSSEIFHIYWWPLFGELVTFALQIFFLYTYWFSWDRIRPAWHQFLGYGYAVVVFLQTLLINTVASGMLTPGSSDISWGQSGLVTMSLDTLMSWWFNATTWILQFHRLAAALSYFGFILAMLAMFHYLDRKDDASRSYWDLVGSYGLAWGLLGLIFQPLIGIIYMSTIKSTQISSFAIIMLGQRAWEMLLMVGLLSFLFITVFVYFFDRKSLILNQPENKLLHLFFRLSVIIAAVCGFILVQPSTLASWVNPLGYMSYKLVALFILVMLGAIALAIDVLRLKKPLQTEWGNLSHVARSAAIIAGIIGIWIVVVMGYVRESARSPWLINKIIPVPGGQTYPTPIPPGQIFVVWFIITAMTLAIFWFVSKVTAEHPEKAEEV